MKCIKFWIKVIHIPNDRLPKHAYDMLYGLDQYGKNTWASEIKYVLNRTGFGYVWISQTIGDVKFDLNEFKQRLIDIEKQKWYSSVNDNEKLYVYSLFKTELDIEKYMVCVPILNHRIALSQLRCSSHHLNIEIGRHNNIERERRLCTLCMKQGGFVIEDEYHFIFDCYTYNNRPTCIRKSYLGFIEKYAHNYVELVKTNAPVTLQLAMLCDAVAM